jgi:hypothetical protein
VHLNKFLIIKSTRCTNFSNLVLEWNSTCFGQFLCPSTGAFHCTHNNGICHRGLLTAFEQDQDGTWNCPKHVEFHSKNIFEKLVHLVGFIISNKCWFRVLSHSSLPQNDTATYIYYEWITTLIVVITWGLQGGMPHQYFSYLRRIFLWLLNWRRAYKEWKYFINDWRRVKRVNKENMSFTGRRIEASDSSVSKGGEALYSALPLSTSRVNIPDTSITFMKK